MTTSDYFWQGGRKIPIAEASSDITVHAADPDAARSAADRAGVALAEVGKVAPGLVRATVTGDRDAAMARLRAADNVVHHVYRATADPASEYLITDTFFVKFKPGTAAAAVARFLREEHLELVRDLGDDTLLVRVTTATGKNPIKTANGAAQRGEVEYAEPNLVRRLQRFAFIPGDAFFKRQWHLSAPAAGTDLALGAGIFAPEAWEITRGGRDVVIAVADDGFDVTHPDFQGAGKIAGRLNARLSGNRVLFDDNVLPRAGDYHGTPCAGVALAEINGQGTVGVAPGCAFLAVRFPLDFDDDAMIQLFDRISRHADVVSCSWGYGPGDFPMSQPFHAAIARLARSGGRRGKGLVICVAAGNNNCPVKDHDNARTYRFLDERGAVQRYSGPIDRWLAAHPDVITVSACTSLKTRSCYSSWGREISVCAPTDNWDDLGVITPHGRGVVTTDNEGFGRRSDFTAGSRYTDAFGGTSSATPTVAGVCALALSRNPALSAAEVKRIIQETADRDLKIESETAVNERGEFHDGFSLWFGHGKVNALRAVTAVAPQEEAVVDHTARPSMAIPDNGAPISSKLIIDHEGDVNDIRVAIDVTHTFVGDLRIDVTAPDGTAVTLHDHDGGATADLRKVYTVTDLPALRALIGTRLRGTWTLRVVDTWSFDVGRLNSWRLVARAARVAHPASPRGNRVARPDAVRRRVATRDREPA